MIGTTKEIFNFLKQEWKKETYHLSSISEICSNKNYQEIIQLGWYVVPIIIDDLREDPDFWFPALKRITGTDPTHKEDAEKVKELANYWIVWWDSIYDMLHNPYIKHIYSGPMDTRPPAKCSLCMGPASSNLHFFNACTDPCDMYIGPCACGAWHAPLDSIFWREL